ncbi:hypothetical protein C8R42DRAFT_721381 [Lentinula raphanica]|nr:hypothetical protein C8R42DRAFT_721381 [Lentinula raphanica]
MANYSFIFLAIFAFCSQNAISYPLNQSFGPLKTRRFEFSPLFGQDTQTNFLPTISSALQTGIGKPYLTASSETSLSAGGSASHRSGSTTSEDDETHSVIGTLPPLPTSSSIQLVTTTHILTTSSSLYPEPTVSPTAIVNSLASLSTHEEKQWKIIGIGLIVVAFIASMILLTVFFESWWGFLKDVCGGKANGLGGGVEEMIPDSEEKRWQFNLSSEDGHRYPSGSSTESINIQTQKLKSPYPYPITPKPLFQPPSYFKPHYDPHPLEPLFRRPSIKTTESVMKSPSMLPYS